MPVTLICYSKSIKDKKPAWWMTYTPFKKVERFNPKSNQLTTSKNEKILGGEATLWTEYVTNKKELWHQLLPRLAAFGKALNSK